MVKYLLNMWYCVVTLSPCISNRSRTGIRRPPSCCARAFATAPRSKNAPLPICRIGRPNSRRRHSRGERRLSSLAALRTAADMGAMFRDHGRTRLGQVKHLARAMAFGHRWRQRCPAALASIGIMVDHNIRRHHLPQGLARMPFLATAGLTRRLAQAHGPRWLLQPIARRRLAAVAAVEAEPALQLANPGLETFDQTLQRGVLHQQPLDLRDQEIFAVARRIRLIRRLSHWQLDSRHHPSRQGKSNKHLGSYQPLRVLAVRKQNRIWS